jgi:hypothetical protein
MLAIKAGVAFGPFPLPFQRHNRVGKHGYSTPPLSCQPAFYPYPQHPFPGQCKRSTRCLSFHSICLIRINTPPATNRTTWKIDIARSSFLPGWLQYKTRPAIPASRPIRGSNPRSRMNQKTEPTTMRTDVVRSVMRQVSFGFGSNSGDTNVFSSEAVRSTSGWISSNQSSSLARIPPRTPEIAEGWNVNLLTSTPSSSWISWSGQRPEFELLAYLCLWQGVQAPGLPYVPALR